MWNVAPATRVLYSWTTAEQVAEIRQGGALLTRSERAGLGRGYAFTSIDAQAARTTGAAAELLNGLSVAFEKARFAWPHAWATRMGWPGEDYGDQLLRIVLKPEAWIVVVFDRGGVAVIDLENGVVSLEAAVQNLERVGAIYFYRQDVTGVGSSQNYYCAGGYREFIVGNEAMIEEWSLGTEQIRARIAADADLIDTFLRAVRPSPTIFTAATFNTTVACTWQAPVTSDLDRYLRALGIPSEYYMPMPAQLAALSNTLRASLFDPDPLVVRPGE